MIGLGSAVFHPESSRVARLASGGRHGFAQAFFQVGGNVGSAVGPLAAAFFVLPHGRSSIAWFSLMAIVGMLLLWNVGNWYRRTSAFTGSGIAGVTHSTGLSRDQTRVALALLLGLLFSKYVYLASFGSYYTFYLMHRFNLTVRSAQVHLFLFLGAVAAGTIFGGPIGDRFGRRRVILWSILGVLPFSLALPYADLFWTRVLTVIIGLILASAFSAIIVYRAGARARPGGRHRGPVFRVCLRHRRPRRGRAWRAGRPHQHHGRLSRVLVSTGDWRVGILVAAYRTAGSW